MDIDEISTRPETGTQGGGLADEAKQAAQDAKAAVAREMDEAKTRAAGAARQIKDGARNAGDRIAALLSEQTERQKSDVAESLRSVAQTMRDAARDQPEGIGARLVDEAAWRLEDVSSRLDENSVADMAEDVARFGRQNPALFLAGCLAAGFAAGRFLTAGSAESRSGAYSGRASDRPNDQSDPLREPSDFGAAATSPAEGFSDYAAGAATKGQDDPWAAGASGGAASASPSWAAGSSGGIDPASQSASTTDSLSDLDDVYAQEGVASDARVGTGYPADAGADERAPFGSGAASEGGEPEGGTTRGGGRDGGF
jgi:hypothetical protein